MGFARQGVWVMGYHGLMGYGVQIPAHQLGGPKKLWDFRGYGLSGAWVTRVSTVLACLEYIAESSSPARMFVACIHRIAGPRGKSRQGGIEHR